MISALLLLVLAPAASIEGSVRAEGTREPIRHAAVQVVELNRHAAVDERGAFVIPGVPAGRWRLRASALGFQPFAVTVHVPAEGAVRLDLELSPAPLPLSRLEVRGRAEAAEGPEAERARFDAAVQPAVAGMSRAQIRALPAMAEPDVLRAAQALPGVVALNDLNAQLHVRGGAPDQNLFLVDGARVFAPYHLFGVAGVFNTDAVAGMELHRGALPARYGGALSAVMDVRQRAEGEPLGAAGGIGSLSGRAAAHGPVGAEGGWMLALRSSRARVPGFRYLAADHPHAFEDAHARIAIHPGRGHRLRASAFASSDEFGLRAPAGPMDLRAAWRNAAVSLGWEVTRGAWTVAVSGWGSGYTGDLGVGVLQGSGGSDPVDNRVTAGGGRVEAAGPGVRIGAEVERGQLALAGSDTQGRYLYGASRRHYTIPAAYVEAGRHVGAVRLAPGLRVARVHPSGRLLVEPRLAARVALAPGLALTLGAGRAHQHLSTLRDDRQALPGTALWFAHPDTVSRADGVGASLDGWIGTAWSVTAGGYARRFHDVVRWMPVGRRDIQQVTRDDGRAAGAELSIRRHAGPVTGWIGYGWGRARIHDPIARREVDAAWDRRHALDAAVFHRPKPWLALSAQATYGSGMPFWPWIGNTGTPRLDPLLGQVVGGDGAPVYADRQMRYPAYFRLDVGARAEVRLWGAELQPVLGLRNVTRRANVLYYRAETRMADDGSARPVLVPVHPFPSAMVVTVGLEARL